MGERNRRNVKSHPNKNSHVSKRKYKSIINLGTGIIQLSVINTVIKAEMLVTHASFAKPRDLLSFI